MKIIDKYFSAKGRIRRSRLLQIIFIAALIVLGAWFIDERYISPNLCEFNEDWICYLPGEVREGIKLEHIAAAIMALPIIFSMIRKLHDHNKSGWYLLLAFTGIGILPLLFWFFVNGDPEPNQYG